MKELQIFNNKEFGQVRVIELDGQPWIVGKDVADKLGYQNGSRDIERHVEEEDRKYTNIFDGTQNRLVTVINESGLYALVLNSKMPAAKRFKHWVTSEVLPSIRQNGGYIAPGIQSLDLLQGMLDQMKMQSIEIQRANDRSQKAIETTQAIQSAIVEEYDDWRSDIKHKVAVIQRASNQTYSDTWNMLYDLLEKRARCDLSTRVNNGRFRMQESGATKTAVEAFCRLDVIEADLRLKEIFTAIVKEYAVKYVA